MTNLDKLIENLGWANLAYETKTVLMLLNLSKVEIETRIETLENTPTTVAASYKVYTALLTQVGTDAPTAVVMENTLGGTVTFSYTSTGIYTANLLGVFTANKTVTLITGNYNSPGQLGRTFRLSNDVVTIYTNETTPGGVSVDDVLSGTTFEIRVYN